MRTLSISWLPVAIAGALLVGCSSDSAVGAPPAAPVDWHAFDVPKTAVTASSGPTPQERLVAQAYVNALAATGFAGVTPLLNSDTHFTFPGIPDARGRDAVLRALDTVLGAFDSRAFASSRVWRTESFHAVEWTMSGVQNRDWMGVAATHKPVVIAGLTLLETKDDGTIIDAHLVFDVATVKAQLGAGPKELAGLPAPTMATGAPQVFEQTRTPDEASNVAIARGWLDGLEKTDDGAYLASLTDDVQVVDPERPQPLRGRDDLKAYFRAMHKAIAELDTTVDEAFGVGRFAVIEYTINGEQVGALSWVPAKSNRVVRLHVVDVVETRDGKIAHVWRFSSLAEVAET
jgi:ketosteroid isomerase-like protein